MNRLNRQLLTFILFYPGSRVQNSSDVAEHARTVKAAKGHMNNEWKRSRDSSSYNMNKSTAFLTKLLLDTRVKFNLDDSFVHSRNAVQSFYHIAKNKNQCESGKVVVRPNLDDVLIGENRLKNETYNQYKSKCVTVSLVYELADDARKLQLLEEIRLAFTRFLLWDDGNKQYHEIDAKLVRVKIQ